MPCTVLLLAHLITVYVSMCVCLVCWRVCVRACTLDNYLHPEKALKRPGQIHFVVMPTKFAYLVDGPSKWH